MSSADGWPVCRPELAYNAAIMTSLELDSSFRSALRAAAHALRPVVQVGDKGLAPSVLAEIDRALTAHGLIKVRVAGDDRAARVAMQAEVCQALQCAPVHHIGKVLVLYRPTAADPLGRRFRAAPAPATVADGPFVPKRYAAEGKTEAPPKARAKRAAKPVRAVTARERYLGTSDKPQRPTLHRTRAAGVKRNTGGRGSSLTLSSKRRRG